MNLQSEAVERRRFLILAAAFFAGAMALVFTISIRRKVDIDEHVFITAGALLGRRGLILYRDFHYNHMPAQVIIYALLFRCTSHLLLAARLFQDLCAAGLATAMLCTAYHAFYGQPARKRRMFALGAGVLMLSDPLFSRTAGLAWNHDFPVLAAILGFLALRRGLKSARPIAWTLASGLLVGVSVTGRLSFAPAVAAYLLLIGLYPSLALGRRLSLLGAFAMGGCVAALPSIWIWAQSPWNAFFGNFLYPHLNTKIHALHDARQRFSFAAILWYYLTEFVALPPVGLLRVMFVVLMAATLRFRQVTRRRIDCELFAVLAAVILLTAGGFMPAPPYPQYFYAAAPFIVLGIVLCLAARESFAGDRFQLKLAGLGLAFCVVCVLPQYRGIGMLPWPSTWTPIRAHSIGRDVTERAGPGKILTLESIYPLEGSDGVYAEAATSRFGLRVAELLTPAERIRYVMPTPDELDSVFTHDPPAGLLIVLGTDGRIEKTLIREAESHGYRRTVLADGALLWMPRR